MNLEKIPYSIEFEQSVLGSILIDYTVIPDILILVSPDDFFREEHKEIMKAVKEIYTEQKPVEILSVADRLKNSGKLEEVGGITYLARLAGSVPNSANGVYYAQKVREKSILRKAMKYAQDIENEASAESDIKEIHALAQNILSLQVAEADTPFSETFTEEDFKILAQSKRWYSKHLARISKKVPFMRGENIVVAGRTSTGKTQLALNLAMDFIEQGAKVGYVSMEMGKIQLLTRLMNWEYGSEKQTLLSEIDVRKPEWQELAKGMFTQKKYKRFFFYEKSNEVDDIVSWIEKIRPDIVFIDYIQMIRCAAEKTFGRNYEIGVVARKIRQEISKERCVVVMSQMNRLKTDRPDLSQIRDSGEIEQTATSVLFIDRPDIQQMWDFKIRVMKNQTLGAISDWLDLFLKPNGEFSEEDK